MLELIFSFIGYLFLWTLFLGEDTIPLGIIVIGAALFFSNIDNEPTQQEAMVLEQDSIVEELVQKLPSNEEIFEWAESQETTRPATIEDLVEHNIVIEKPVSKETTIQPQMEYSK